MYRGKIDEPRHACFDGNALGAWPSSSGHSPDETLSKLDIPITFDPKQKETIRELILFVSHNQGQVWDNMQ